MYTTSEIGISKYVGYRTRCLGAYTLSICRWISRVKQKWYYPNHLRNVKKTNRKSLFVRVRHSHAHLTMRRRPRAVRQRWKRRPRRRTRRPRPGNHRGTWRPRYLSGPSVCGGGEIRSKINNREYGRVRGTGTCDGTRSGPATECWIACARVRRRTAANNRGDVRSLQGRAWRDARAGTTRELYRRRNVHRRWRRWKLETTAVQNDNVPCALQVSIFSKSLFRTFVRITWIAF